MASEFFGRQRECRFYTAGCGNKMVVSVTGPRAANELGGPVIPCIYRLSFILEFTGTFFHKKTQTYAMLNPANIYTD